MTAKSESRTLFIGVCTRPPPCDKALITHCCLQIIHYDDNDDDDDDDDADSDKSSVAATSATGQLSPSTPGSISGSESGRPHSVVATPPGHVTSAVEGQRRGRGVPIVPSRLTNLLPSVSTSSSSTTAVPPPAAAAAAVPLSLVPILAVVDVAGSAIVPAVTPLLVQRSRDYQDGDAGETIDLSTKGRRRALKDSDDDGVDDDAGVVPLIKVPRCRSISTDDHQSAPLNLSVPRDKSRDSVPRDSGASSSYRVLCEWDASEDSVETDAGADTPATSAAAECGQSASQILLLSGKQYEIVPLGDGRWISRNEYELQRGLQKSSSGVELTGAARTTLDSRSLSGVEHNGNSGQSPATSASSSSAAAAAAEVRKDEELEKLVGPDEVSSTIVSESETCKDDDDDGQLHIAEDVASEHDDDDDDDDGDHMKAENEQGQCTPELPTKHNHTDTTTTTTTTTSTDVAVDGVDIISPRVALPSQ